MTQSKNKVGHPSKKDTTERIILEKLYRLGMTDKQVADIIDVTETTIHNWKKKDPEFFKSLKDWKSGADTKVEKSLLQRALGYEYDEVTYEKSKTGGLGIKMKNGEIQTLKHTPTTKTKVVTKEIIPDVTAQIFWLKNRQPDDWRDKKEVDMNVNYAKHIEQGRKRAFRDRMLNVEN